MGNIKTQTRTLYEREPRVLKLAHWANPIVSDTVARSVQQTTTSFRSGSRSDTFIDGESTLTTGWRSSAFDNGHEFDTISTIVDLSHKGTHKLASADGRSYWIGPKGLDTTGISTTFTTAPVWDINQANVIGSQFIRQTTPTKPSAKLASSIGELWADKGVASFIGSATLSDKLNVFQKAGSEYLNVVFGWLPFVGELTNVLRAVSESEKILSQYVRDSGKVIRRKRSFDPIQTNQPVRTFANRSLAWPVTASYFEPLASKRSGTLELREGTETIFSFSAAYTYYLETGGNFFADLKRFEQLSNKLLGTRITPEVLWELVPFSWLVDWMATTGTYVANATSFNNDDLVLRYGYVMRQQKHWQQWSLPGLTIGGKPLGTVVVATTSIRKSRVRSTPYGFGRNPAAFSGQQWAILAALGMTRAPNKLIS